MFMDLFTLTLPRKSLPIQFSFLVTPLRFLTVSFLLFSFSSFLLFTGEASSISTTPRPCIHDHFSALIQLKRGFHLDEDSYTKLSSWNYHDTNCCTWEGIGCDNAAGHVTSLDVGYFGIRGQIDFESLFRLHSLRELNLAVNDFDPAPFPFGFDQLKHLTHLNLSELNFYGQIPLDISRLTNLVSLDLSYNRFSSESHALKLENPSIDILVQNLSRLRALQLDEVNISAHGTKWGQAISSALPRLHMLSLQSCSLSGSLPSFLVNLTNLEELYLSDNNFSGSIPLSYASEFRNLRVLYLSYNSLSGTIPTSLLSTLQVLHLNNNEFSGRVGEFHNASSSPLLHVNLANNQFSGEIHSLFCNSTSLSVLDLSENNLSGQIPQCFGEVSDVLELLNLRGNAFSGKLLMKFKESCSLQTLDLSGNQLKGRIPRTLPNCEMLKLLNLGNNQIQDTFPSWLESLSHLQVLILAHNKFHGPIRLAATNHTVFPLLKIIDLSSNNFTGSVPPSLFWSCKPMIEEDRSNSQLPHEVLGANYQFKFTYNQVPITVVAEGNKMELVKILRAFTSIDISNNQFQGEIPKSFGNLRSLHGLNMSHNNFTGEIPTSFGNLRDLELLDLSQNKLTGEIPWQLTELTFLEVLNLSENLLTGKIPQSRLFLTFTNESFQGNSGLCGPPLSKECGEANVTEQPLEESESEAKINWRSMWIGFGAGYGVGFGIFFWALALWRNGMIKFERFTNKVIVRLFRS